MENKHFLIGCVIFLLVMVVGMMVFESKINFQTNDLRKDQTNLTIIEETISFMEENNITILGLTTCPYCIKQLNVFGDYKEELLEKKLYIYCDITEHEKCSGVSYVPSWKQNDQIINVGYLNLTQIVEGFNL